MSFVYEPAAMPARPQGPSLPALLLGMVIHPHKTLSAVNDGPRKQMLVPLIMLIILLALRVVIEAPLQNELAKQKHDAELQQIYTPEDLKTLPPEALEAPPSPPLILGLLAGPGMALFGWLILAGLLHILGLAFGGQNTYTGLLSTTAWASIPLALRALLQIIYLTLTQKAIVGSGLSGLVTSTDAINAASPHFLAALLGQVDVFAIWFVALVAVAVLVTARVSRNKAVLITTIYVVLALIVGVAPSLLAGIFSGGTF